MVPISIARTLLATAPACQIQLWANYLNWQYLPQNADHAVQLK